MNKEVWYPRHTAGQARSGTQRMKTTLGLSQIAWLTFLVGGCDSSVHSMSNDDIPSPWVIRTDFSDDEEWASICESITAPQLNFGIPFLANVRCVSDGRYAMLDPADLIRALPDDYPGFLCFVIDAETLASDERQILVVVFSPQSVDADDFERTPRQTPLDEIRTFRAVPSMIQCIENNLSIANMDFEDFAESVDEDGVFRGFSDE
jgi:hypothetical protein